MKIPPIEIGNDGERVAVVLLRPVRASNGQEFLAGWRVGFTPRTAEFLVANGYARAERVVAEPQTMVLPPEPPPLSAPEVVAHGVGVVGEPVEPKTSTRRRK